MSSGFKQRCVKVLKLERTWQINNRQGFIISLNMRLPLFCSSNFKKPHGNNINKTSFLSIWSLDESYNGDCGKYILYAYLWPCVVPTHLRIRRKTLVLTKGGHKKNWGSKKTSIYTSLLLQQELTGMFILGSRSWLKVMSSPPQEHIYLTHNTNHESHP